MDQLTGFGYVTALDILENFFKEYGEKDKIYLKENSMKMMQAYDPSEPLARLIEQFEKRQEFARSGGQSLTDAMMMLKGILPF